MMENFTFFKTALFIIIMTQSFYGQKEVDQEKLSTLLNRLELVGSSGILEPENLFNEEEKQILRSHLLEKYAIDKNFENDDVYVYDGGYCSDDYGVFPVGGPYNINIISTMTQAIFAGDFTDQKELYGIEDDTKSLVYIDKTTGTITSVGPLLNVPATHNVSGLAWNQADQTMYASSLNSSISETTLYSVDLSTGALTVIGNTGMSGGIWLAIDSSGNAYMADLIDDSLYSVDLTDASSSLIGPLGVDLNFAQDADFHPDSDVLYMGGYLGSGVNNFYEIDTTTGAATALGTVNNNCAELTIVAIDGLFGGFPLPYCGPIGYSSNVGPITYVKTAGIDNTSDSSIGGSPAHEDFTDQIGEMAQGVEYTIQLEGTTLDENNSSFTVFIDWNQDEMFNNDEERYEIGIITDSNGEDGKKAEGYIFVPVDAEIGETRMRIIKRYTSSDQYATDGCTPGSPFGQTEDYTITVLETPAVACETPINISVDHVNGTSVDISWSDSQTITENYIWKLFTEGSTDDNDLVSQGSVSGGTQTLTIENLEVNTSYDFFVRTNCDADGLSIWEGPLNFETTALSIFDHILTNNILIYPNPTDGHIFIDSDKEVVAVKVFSITGQILVEQLNNNIQEISIEEYESGIYFIDIETQYSKKIIKVIKQ